MKASAQADHRIIEMRDAGRGAGKCGLSGADFVAWPERFRPLTPPEAGQRRTRVGLIQYKPRPPPPSLDFSSLLSAAPPQLSDSDFAYQSSKSN